MTANISKHIKVGIIGSAGIARGLYKIVSRQKNMLVSAIFVRDFVDIYRFKQQKDIITKSPDDLMEMSDIVLLASEDADFDDKIIKLAFENQLSVIVMSPNNLT
ncbi:hypothetical protein [Pararhodonellum marinum]|uniref:hypothetical protein n=1 Tax=Pararhodonellum marinum TaxID=2755358 RepID=UPI00188ECF15|nr:hypothetical protein [Pararhodonellum marinum]